MPARQAESLRFLVIIPAHNEASRLPDLLQSLAAQDYRDYEVWVIADNCTDSTAAVAEAGGARCLVRTDPEHPGKGQALEFAFGRLDESRAEAVVIVDADSVVNPGFLCALAASVGDRFAEPLVRQASSRLRPGDSAQSLLLAAESALEDRLYYGAKGRVGFPVLLRGGGMCFTRALLRDHPWHAASVGEDVEYATSLLRAGIAPQFVEGAKITSAAPSRRTQFVVQRTRWGEGHRQATRRHALAFLWQGISCGDPRWCDAGLGMFVTSKSALFGVALVMTISAWLLRKFVGLGPTWVGLAGVVALGAYGLLGLALCRPTLGQLLRAALSLPALLALRLWMHLRGLLRRGPLSWERTPE